VEKIEQIVTSRHVEYSIRLGGRIIVAVPFPLHVDAHGLLPFIDDRQVIVRREQRRKLLLRQAEELKAGTRG